MLLIWSGVEHAWPRLPITIAVPVSWHIGRTPPAEMFAFFSRSSATKRSFGLASGSSRIDASCARWAGRSRCGMSCIASKVRRRKHLGLDVQEWPARCLDGLDAIGGDQAIGRGVPTGSLAGEQIGEYEFGHGTSVGRHETRRTRSVSVPRKSTLAYRESFANRCSLRTSRIVPLLLRITMEWVVGPSGCVAHALDDLAVGDPGRAKEDVVASNEIRCGEDAIEIVSRIQGSTPLSLISWPQPSLDAAAQATHGAGSDDPLGGSADAGEHVHTRALSGSHDGPGHIAIDDELDPRTSLANLFDQSS